MSNPAPSPVPAAAPLLVRTVRIDDPGDLVGLLPPGPDTVAWVHGSDGLVGWGTAASFETSGPARFDAARAWWDEVVGRAVVRDEVDRSGTGLVAFGSFDFAPAGAGTLVVPEVTVGRRDGHCWVTVAGHGITAPPALRPASPPEPPAGTRFTDGAVGRDAWQEIVAEAIGRITEADLDKVVLARETVARFERPLDVRWALARLARDYPSCWTFHVGGFFGSTPEMLVRLERALVTSRVLAGTIRRTGDDAHDAALAGSLSRSSKDLTEHEFAVRSVSDVLAAHCSALSVPEAPFVLHLPNVMHLATDVTGVARPGTTALDLVAGLHPSAAVGGTPTAEAVAVIEAIERLDRGRYAGPVGWIGADGDGDWGIGLRSAELLGDGTSARLFAGCGIVADSVPADEAAESDAKLIPMRHALS